MGCRGCKLSLAATALTVVDHSPGIWNRGECVSRGRCSGVPREVLGGKKSTIEKKEMDRGRDLAGGARMREEAGRGRKRGGASGKERGEDKYGVWRNNTADWGPGLSPFYVSRGASGPPRRLLYYVQSPSALLMLGSDVDW